MTVLSRLTGDDISSDALPMFGLATVDVGLSALRVGAAVGRPASLATRSTAGGNEHATLLRILIEAGRDLGLVEIGYNALTALRLEKSFGIWSHGVPRAYTPGMTGMDRFVAFAKPDFIGRVAALNEKREGAGQRCS